MKSNTYLSVIALLLVSIYTSVYSQNITLSGELIDNSENPIPFANIQLASLNSDKSILKNSDDHGAFLFINLEKGNYILTIVSIDHKKYSDTLELTSNRSLEPIVLKDNEIILQEVVITGTMTPVSKSDSPVPVEVYSQEFFKKNPTPSVYEALQNINGVRPQINCSVCNTGDIHINGLEGPYTMVLIDGMPIVSGLSTVYGLSGIPMSLIDRVEIVKGPASTLYGSEAVGGLINVITKNTRNAPQLFADVYATSWGEVNADLSTKQNLGKKAETLLGVNYYNYQNSIDNNEDNFTDLTLQHRFSVFNKWNFKRKNKKLFTLAGRYYYEDRFGGDLNWTKEFRGTDSIYGESIYTSRWEAYGTYQLPTKENITLQFSANSHEQNSVYGNVSYIADQKIMFGQMLWNKKIGKNHQFLTGTVLRYTYYDDNTVATELSNQSDTTNAPTKTYLPGIFLQDEIAINKNNKLLLGMRYDYNSSHGNIFTPRANYKWNSKNKNNILRFSFGTGYRVVNVFTEEHAAFTGSREVIIQSELAPERSYNGNINYVKKIYTKKDLYFGIDASLFYTYFTNKIFADYDTDASLIIYKNLEGHAVSNGASVNFDITYKNWVLLLGTTIMEVYSEENNQRKRQELTEQFSGTWSLSYKWKRANLTFDYNGSFYSPMELPTLGENDPRPTNSPWYSLQNIQVTKKVGASIEIYGGIKNILNWTPWRSMDTDMITRANDPFEKDTTDPNQLSFDASYVYGPNQGIRGFLGLRYQFNK